MDVNGKKIFIWASIGGLPLFLMIFALFIAVFLVLGLFESSGTSGSGNFVYDSECNYEATMVTVMDSSNTRVLATVSLEDYIIGVVCPEIGACSGKVASMQEHYIKAKFVASRTYVLARDSYSSSDKSITIKASTRDQQWCDLKKGCVVTFDGEYYNTFPGDYSGDQAIKNRYTYTAEDLELLRKYYKETYGELYLSNDYDGIITSLSTKDATEYKSSTQNYWNDLAKNGKNYIEILDATGSSNVSDSEDYVNKKIYRLGDYCKSTYVGGNGNLVELVSYPSEKDVGSTKEINKVITSILSEKQIDDLNNYIISSVDSAGYGTGAAVATAGQSLIYGLYQHGYHLPYWYDGGHSLGIKIGIDSKWGSNGRIDSDWVSYNNGKGRYTYSYDCSAFVSWAIKNACKSNFSGDSSTGFNNYGSGISLKEAKPGDLMVKPGSHVRLIVKNTGDGVIAAESASDVDGAKHGAVAFISYTSAGSYKIVNMEKWYKNNCNSSR